MSDDDQNKNPDEPNDTGQKTSLSKEDRIKKLAKVVCICKGINLGRVLKVLDGCETVDDVNRRAGTGSGGCQGQRCGPRIKYLLHKLHEKNTTKIEASGNQRSEEADQKKDENDPES